MGDQPTRASAPLDDWSPTPYAQRPSQNLTFWGFLKERVIHLVFGAGAGAFAGNQAAKLLKLGTIKQQSMEIAGALLGTIAMGFRGWEKQEGRHLSANEVYEAYKTLPGLYRSNEEIAADNAMLKQMIAFEKTREASPQKHISAALALHDGMVQERTHEQMK